MADQERDGVGDFLGRPKTAKRCLCKVARLTHWIDGSDDNSKI